MKYKEIIKDNRQGRIIDKEIMKYKEIIKDNRQGKKIDKEG